MCFLQLENINTFYGLSHILFDINIEIKKGEFVCLLGRNGVGKSTTLKSIMGLAPIKSGKINFDGIDISNFKSNRIAYLGIGYVPENRIIFPDLTILENLEMGIKNENKIKNKIEGFGWDLEKIYELFPILKDRHEQFGGTLSGGEQQMLTIARTLMGNPTLLLLDEPSEGLAPVVVQGLFKQIQLLKESGLTILLSEMKSDFGLLMSDKVYLLEKGSICWRGTNEKLQEDPEVIKEFLGV